MAFDFSQIVASGDPVRTIPGGELVFRDGDPGRSMYVLRSGSVQIRVGDLVFETVKANGIFGEMAVLDETPQARSASALALTPCEVVEIGRERLLEIVREHPSLGLHLCAVMVNRLRATTFLAHHDPVTGLPNRHRFRELCTTAIARRERRGAPMAVLTIDLDHFGSINDSLGSAAGDEVLRVLAKRFTETLRTVDALARLGSDEFVVLIEEMSNSNGLVTVAERILEAVRRPVRIASSELSFTASVGISCFPQDGRDVDALVHAAEFAMRNAIDQGRNRFCFHSAELHQLAAEAHELRNQLRRALQRDEFYLEYQPRVSVATGQISGVEALVRWRHPERGIVPPSKFIPVAEQTGLIDAIGEWVLRSACRQMLAWTSSGMPPFRMAVNLSLLQLRRVDLIDRIAAILKTTGLDPHLLEVEITESAMMDDPGRTVFMLSELRSRGISVALDDFGTEYSSFGHLKQFPLDFMKIDQSFVRGIPGQEKDVAIAETIVSLSRRLKLPTIAEGVETREQLEFFKARGCEEYQGYYFSPPLSAADLESRLPRNLSESATPAAHSDTGTTREETRLPVGRAGGPPAEGRRESARPSVASPGVGDGGGYTPFDAEHAEVRNFSRTVGEMNWLLVILVLLYHFFKGTPENNVAAVFAGTVVFATVTIALHYLGLFPRPTRGLLAVESWIMIAFITWVLYFTGGLDSVLVPLYYLPVIVSALTLGQVATLLQIGLIAACYAFLGYSEATAMLSQGFVVSLGAQVAPMVLVAYMTTMLSSDILNALARLKLISETDELTGVFNVRAFNALAAQEFRIAARYGRDLSLMMIDSDSLKTVNDTYGHEAGDKLIKAVVAGVRASVKSNDIVARYGGDEFVCLFPGATPAAAAAIGERIRATIADTRLEFDGKRLPTSVSIGVANYPSHGDAFETLARNADKALYLSKNAGRNRVTTYAAP